MTKLLILTFTLVFFTWHGEAKEEQRGFLQHNQSLKKMIKKKKLRLLDRQDRREFLSLAEEESQEVIENFSIEASADGDSQLASSSDSIIDHRECRGTDFVRNSCENICEDMFPGFLEGIQRAICRDRCRTQVCDAIEDGLRQIFF